MALIVGITLLVCMCVLQVIRFSQIHSRKYHEELKSKFLRGMEEAAAQDDFPEFYLAWAGLHIEITRIVGISSRNHGPMASWQFINQFLEAMQNNGIEILTMTQALSQRGSRFIVLVESTALIDITSEGTRTSGIIHIPNAKGISGEKACDALYGFERYGDLMVQHLRDETPFSELPVICQEAMQTIAQGYIPFSFDVPWTDVAEILAYMLLIYSRELRVRV